MRVLVAKPAVRVLVVKPAVRVLVVKPAVRVLVVKPAVRVLKAERAWVAPKRKPSDGRIPRPLCPACQSSRLSCSLAC